MHPYLIIFTLTLAAGFALLLFVFIRQALRDAAQAPEAAAKMTRLRKAWGARRVSSYQIKHNHAI